MPNHIDLVLCFQVMAGNPRRRPSSWCASSLSYCCLIAFAVILAAICMQYATCLLAQNILPNDTVHQQVLSLHFCSMQHMCVLQEVLFRGHNLAALEHHNLCLQLCDQCNA